MRLLHHLPLSPYSRKIRLVLAEKRLPFELQLEKVWERRDDYLHLNPANTVPTLVDDGLAIPDSGVICEYLEETYPDPPLLPRARVARIEARRLVAWFDGKFAAEVTANLLGEKFMKRMMGRGTADAGALRAGYANLRHHLSYGFRGGVAPVGAGLHRRCGLVRLGAGTGLVCAHEVPSVLPCGPGRPRAWHDAACALR